MHLVGSAAAQRGRREVTVVRVALARPKIVVVVALVHDLAVIDGGAAHEQAVVLVVGFQVGGSPEHLGDPAGIEVAISIVAVGIVVAFVPPLHPVQLAIGQAGIQLAGHLALDEAELNGADRHRQPEWQ
jgi:hypothetical protein